jgi:elongator complex protein 5
MSHLIGSIISGLSRPHFALILLQSSLVQSSLPVLRAFARNQDATTHILLFSLLYPPQTLVEIPCRDGLTVVDRTTEVPGYGDTCPDLSQLILSTIKQGLAPHRFTRCMM